MDGNLLEELSFNEVVKIKLLVDNKSTIDLAKHPLSHKSIKHIERKYHLLRDQISKDKLKIEYCKIELQLVNIITKSLKKPWYKQDRPNTC